MRLIDADELNKDLDLYDRDVCGHCGNEFAAGFEAAWELIADAPTIDAEPVRHCAWSIKETYHGSMYDDGWWVEWSAICSGCGTVVYLDPVSCECGMVEDALAEYNYCPNCGAKMDEVK